MTETEGEQSRLTRRQLLGASAALAVGTTSGCVSQARSILNRSSPSTVSVEIKTPPADADRTATLIARHLAENLDAVGIDATLDILPPVELYREVLLNGEFDVFVSQLPPVEDPDDLRTTLHSVFAEEAGWQNPYSFTDLTVDEHLETQLTARGLERRGVIGDLIDQIKREQPLTTVAYPDAIRAVRSDEFRGWHAYAPRSPLTYVALTRDGGRDPEAETTLQVSTTDPRVTQNLNPLAVEYRGSQTFTRLLYDPLMYRAGGERLPWLAETWQWTRAEETAAEVRLRPELAWHDGVPLTASDVAFTYEFLQDTSLGEIETTVPSPIYRGRSTLIEDVRVVDERTVDLSFGDVTPRVAELALTLPILPEHVWREQTGEANVSGISANNVTEALVWSNAEPVGSGPLRFERSVTDEALYLRRFEDHVLHEEEPPDPLRERFGDGVAFDRLEIRVVPSDETAIELLAAGDLDATRATITHRVVPDIGQNAALSLLVDRAKTPYHVGYNAGTEPFSNPHFRRLVARLLDKQYLVDDALGGYGTPVAHPFDGTDWNPPGSGFDGRDRELPFIGENGEVDVAAARDAFRERGFEFDEDGNLVVQ